ncbi:hypothetical protein ZIOFF_069922 [Zingiber officinale]|uniref:Uncharacterized protein n=1 Tax=Zingiber officinale TaxID=94328 RepID=A0A8J5C6P1_ZINOF|nr:hypothetical protein ZIOFF_069922 [Zingiber officinale]
MPNVAAATRGCTTLRRLSGIAVDPLLLRRQLDQGFGQCAGFAQVSLSRTLTSRMSSNSGFMVTYSSTTYLCFDCEFDLASTAQLVF